MTPAFPTPGIGCPMPVRKVEIPLKCNNPACNYHGSVRIPVGSDPNKYGPHGKLANCSTCQRGKLIPNLPE